MNPRFFVDETDLGLAKALATTVPDVVYPGHRLLTEVPLGARDDVWLEVVGRLSLVVITRNFKIKSTANERRAWIENRVRGFVLRGRHSQSTKMSLKLLRIHWEQIMLLVTNNQPGPWMFVVTINGLRKIDLTSP